MKKPISVKLWYFIIVILLFSILFFLLWIYSSVSLAMVFCDNNFSLFHEHFRCRQPYIASIGFLASFIAFLKAGHIIFKAKSN